MKRNVLASILLYCCGFIAAANLSLLLPQSREYDARWWKVIASSVFAVALILRSAARPRNGGD